MNGGTAYVLGWLIVGVAWIVALAVGDIRRKLALKRKLEAVRLQAHKWKEWLDNEGEKPPASERGWRDFLWQLIALPSTALQEGILREMWERREEVRRKILAAGEGQNSQS